MIEQEQREPSQLEVAAMIADQLGETEAAVRQHIALIVRALGRTQSRQMLNFTLQAEEHGGLLTNDGKKRRTVGGIFFYYVKKYGIPKPGRSLPCQENRTEKAKKLFATTKTAKIPQQHSEKAVPVTTQAHTTIRKGVASTVKITLVGRPGYVLDKGQFIVVTMESTKVPPLPKGLPTVPSTPTQYGIYIAQKSWNKVKEAIQDPEDVLIIEGYPKIDTALGAIAVYASNVTTKKTQQAVKQAQQAASLASQG